jgi:hypothetical protein
MVTIKCVSKTSIISAVYAYTEKKNKDNYISALTKIKSLCHENGYMVNPQFTLSDFEAAQQDSIRIVFDYVQVKGCWFHYVQFVSLHQTARLSTTIRTGQRFPLLVQTVHSVGNETVGSSRRSMGNHIGKRQTYVADSNMQKFIACYINQWVTGEICPEVWNLCQSGQRRTYNDLEGNFQFRDLFSTVF